MKIFVVVFSVLCALIVCETTANAQEDDLQNLTTRSYRPYLIGGWITWSVGFAGAISTMGHQHLVAVGGYPFASMVPVVGPLVTGAIMFREDNRYAPLAGSMLLLSGILQVVGLSLAIIGYIRKKRYRSQVSRPSRFSLAVSPGSIVDGNVVMLSGRF